MPFQSLPQSAAEYSRAQRREIAAAVAAVARQWRRMGPQFDASYVGIEDAMLAIATVAQLRVAESAAAYVPAVMAETGQRVAALGEVVPSSLVGAAGDGRPVQSLLYGAVVHAKQQVYVGPPLYDPDLDEVFTPGPGRTWRQALASSGQWLSQAVGTVLSDTGRAAEKVGMAAHGAHGYVRMLSPPSCSRCAVLAGRVYTDSVAFDRHPACDCRNIPADESVANELTVDTRGYFDSLSESEQNRIFTNDGAEAIREGADINQVVNARRGMSSAITASGRRRLAPVQIGGRDVFVTTEGTTRRGLAYRQMGANSAADVRTAGSRYARTARPRLMPETIREISTDRADYLRLLRANGYLR